MKRKKVVKSKEALKKTTDFMNGKMDKKEFKKWQSESKLHIDKRSLHTIVHKGKREQAGRTLKKNK